MTQFTREVVISGTKYTQVEIRNPVGLPDYVRYSFGDGVFEILSAVVRCSGAAAGSGVTDGAVLVAWKDQDGVETNTVLGDGFCSRFKSVVVENKLIIGPATLLGFRMDYATFPIQFEIMYRRIDLL